MRNFGCFLFCWVVLGVTFAQAKTQTETEADTPTPESKEDPHLQAMRDFLNIFPVSGIHQFIARDPANPMGGEKLVRIETGEVNGSGLPSEISLEIQNLKNKKPYGRIYHLHLVKDPQKASFNIGYQSTGAGPTKTPIWLSQTLHTRNFLGFRVDQLESFVVEILEEKTVKLTLRNTPFNGASTRTVQCAISLGTLKKTLKPQLDSSAELEPK